MTTLQSRMDQLQSASTQLNAHYVSAVVHSILVSSQSSQPYQQWDRRTMVGSQKSKERKCLHLWPLLLSHMSQNIAQVAAAAKHRASAPHNPTHVINLKTLFVLTPLAARALAEQALKTAGDSPRGSEGPSDSAQQYGVVEHRYHPVWSGQAGALRWQYSAPAMMLVQLVVILSTNLD